jgi:hypothetical protein
MNMGKRQKKNKKNIIISREKKMKKYKLKDNNPQNITNLEDESSSSSLLQSQWQCFPPGVIREMKEWKCKNLANLETPLSEEEKQKLKMKNFSSLIYDSRLECLTKCHPLQFTPPNVNTSILSFVPHPDINSLKAIIPTFTTIVPSILDKQKTIINLLDPNLIRKEIENNNGDDNDDDYGERYINYLNSNIFSVFKLWDIRNLQRAPTYILRDIFDYLIFNISIM